MAFLDSGYLIALAIESDEWHTSARRLARRAQAEGWLLLSTWAVMLEVGNALARPRYRERCISILDDFFQDPTLALIPLNELLLRRATSLFKEREDKAWSLTDCISFLVMEDSGIKDALTPDEHFEQAGFRALLRENAKS